MGLTPAIRHCCVTLSQCHSAIVSPFDNVWSKVMLGSSRIWLLASAVEMKSGFQSKHCAQQGSVTLLINHQSKQFQNSKSKHCVCTANNHNQASTMTRHFLLLLLNIVWILPPPSSPNITLSVSNPNITLSVDFSLKGKPVRNFWSSTGMTPQVEPSEAIGNFFHQ